MRSDVEIARAVSEGLHVSLNDAEFMRARELGVWDAWVSGRVSKSREWLAKHGRTEPTKPRPAAAYQTLIDRVRRDVATCARCHREGVPCLVLDVHRTVQADGAEVRVGFPISWCFDCARREVPA